VSSHTVSSDADLAAIKLGEMLEKCLRKLLCQVAVHVVTLVVWLFCRVYVETSSRTKVVRLILAFDVQTSCSWLFGQ